MYHLNKDLEKSMSEINPIHEDKADSEQFTERLEEHLRKENIVSFIPITQMKHFPQIIFKIN